MVDMAISKKLTALFAGVLLAGSFGLAGCDNSASNAGANNSSTTTTENPDAPSGIAKDPKCELINGEMQKDGNREIFCFGDSGVRIPDEENLETYKKYKYYYDTYCVEESTPGKFTCYLQQPNFVSVRTIEQ